MIMAQSAIEWLKKELEDYGSNSHLSLDWNTFDELCEQAKQMEEDNIINAMNDIGKMNVKYANNTIASFTKIEGELFMHDDKQAIEYYNKTYKNKGKTEENGW